MQDLRFLLKTRYTASRALVIRINEYKDVSPLSYAVNDAEEFRSALISELGFPAENISYLKNGEATRRAISREFGRFMGNEIEPDERIIVFFAGHGHTLPGFHGEIGFLVPHDADLSDPSTLVGWHELTKTAEAIPVKHMLFIMDACYGGLALNRNLHPGSTRFLKDMLLRYSRQVLTAGKADEVVADSGGPLADHSVFTGHLLEGLRGKAMTEKGLLTASGLMSYVYNKVATDKDSNQTPHYGHFDGDGDLILNAPNLDGSEENDRKDNDDLIVVPFSAEESLISSTSDKIKHVKRTLANESRSIDLHDFMIEEVRSFLASTSEDNFKANEQFSKEELLDRISKYEEASTDLSILIACLAYWSKPIHKNILQKIIARSTDRLDSRSGLTIWLGLRWYPIILSLYTAGIAAVEAQRYDSIATIFYTTITPNNYRRPGTDQLLIEAVSDALLDFTREKLFKQLPGYEQYHTPLSEYLLKTLQPEIDNIFFVGRSYEDAFDEFEMILALADADRRVMRGEGIWGPIGRFGWKHRDYNPPLSQFIQAAQENGSEWKPLKGGLFGGDIKRFESVADQFQRLIARNPFV